MPAYRILALDGGGAWALIQVQALIDLYDAANKGEAVTGRDVLSDFDLVAANSGGTLTLGGLIKDVTLAELLDYFCDEAKRRSIFVPASPLRDPGGTITRQFGIGPRYDADQKLVGLKSILGAIGEVALPDLPAEIRKTVAKAPDLLFCAFNYDTLREEFFRSNPASKAAFGAPLQTPTLALAIHASTDAPVNYFDAPARLAGHCRYWDGGIGGFNNPALAAVIEAARNLPLERRDDIEVLSLGTGSVVLPLETGAPGENPELVRPRDLSTIVGDLHKLATAILDDPPDAASFHAHVLLGAPDASPRLVRMSPLVQPICAGGTWQLPPGLTQDQFNKLKALEMDAVDQDQVDLLVAFGRQWLRDLVPNQPIRANPADLTAAIGHATYGAAKAAWTALTEPPIA